MHRYDPVSNDESRMKQEFEIADDEGQFEVKVGGSSSGTTYSQAYYVTNTFITTSIGSSDHYFYAYKQNDAPNFQLYRHDTNSSINNSGQMGWWLGGAHTDEGKRSWVDNVRIIPEDGAYFESESLAVPASISGNVSWGVISGTVTLSSGGDYSLEKVSFKTKTTGIYEAASGNSIASSESTSIQYKVNFLTDDKPDTGGTPPYFSETIALEDVHITYLPPTKVLYYRGI